MVNIISLSLTALQSKNIRIFRSKEKSLTQEELKARKDEENLFLELPTVPAILFNVTELPECNQTDESELGSGKKSRTDN